MNDKVKLLVFAAGVFIATLLTSRIVELPLYLLITLTLFFTAFTFVFNSQLDQNNSINNNNISSYNDTVNNYNNS